MSSLRRVRSAAVIALVWGAFWGVATFLLVGTWWLLTFPDAFLRQAFLIELLRQSAIATVVGAAVGTGFTLSLATMRDRRSLDSVSMLRFVLAGAAAALAALTLLFWWIGALKGSGLGFLLTEWDVPAVLAILGAASGAATLAIARRAPITTKDVPTQLPSSRASLNP